MFQEILIHLFRIIILIIKINLLSEYFLRQDTNFIVIVTFYNLTYNELNRCLKSIDNQTYKKYKVCVVDDCSIKNLSQLAKIKNKYKNKKNFKYIKKNKNGGQISSIVKGLEVMKPKKEDVIVLVDGDDELYDNYVFSYLNKIYKKNDINLTFGNYVLRTKNNLGNKIIRPCSKYNLIDMSNKNSFRKNFKFGPSHLKTFKYKLFKKIKEKDLKKNNKYIRTATDLTMMFPMLEMSRNKFICIDKPLYIYTSDHPNSLHNKARKEQIDMNKYVRKSNIYKKLLEKKVETNNLQHIKEKKCIN